jgi:endo-1,4-beta-xylanase
VRPPGDRRPPSRRLALAGALALSACGRRQGEAVAAPSPRDQADPPPLRRMTDTPLGVALATGEAADPARGGQAAYQVSQLTPSWQMKMEYILKDDGTFRFDAPDALADFAASRDMRLHGHTLVWYAQSPPPLARLDGNPQAFDRAVANYIAAVAGHYRGRVSAWDVVNEAVEPEGRGLRDCLYSRNQGGGEAYIASAFHRAREADPSALLILNDYDLETKPAKRATFLRLAERLLHGGVPLQGLGCQSHIDIDLPDGASRTAIADLASLGLPIHVSELDVSLGPHRVLDGRGLDDKLQLQARRYGEVIDAFMALPERQRYAFTVWGLRDPDSWLLKWNPDDKPLLFDGAGAPKPAFWAVADRLRRG